MRIAAPFEPAPHLAVAVSGGADSMALLLLADAWARARRGRVTALTVDHGLRPESGAEARQVARWCRVRGIAHRILRWEDGTVVAPGDVQTAARAARYRLLEDWCRANAVLHLLTAHHMNDQAETFLLRLGHRSGLSGLAAMAAMREAAHLRLLRPMLGFSRARMEAHLTARGQDWVEDPSNRDPAYVRTRLRALAPALSAGGFGAEAQAALAGRLGRARRGVEGRLAALLARAAEPHPAGFILLDLEAILRSGAEIGTRALARTLGAVSGGTYPPRGARLDRLFEALGRADFAGRTLAGCRILPRGPKAVLVCREPEAVAGPVPAGPGVCRWDRRFRLRIAGAGTAQLGALGAAGWAALRADAPGLPALTRARAIPAPVRATLPALRDARGLLSVPHLGYRRSGEPAGTLWIADVRPDLPETLGGPRFAALPVRL